MTNRERYIIAVVEGMMGEAGVSCRNVDLETWEAMESPNGLNSMPFGYLPPSLHYVDPKVRMAYSAARIAKVTSGLTTENLGIYLRSVTTLMMLYVASYGDDPDAHFQKRMDAAIRSANEIDPNICTNLNNVELHILDRH